jgi:molybdopterin/thiamine biosynthesis adenylyltransferase
MGLTTDQRRRYERQLMLPEVGDEGQARLLSSRVLVVGAGGLGGPVGLYLAAAGVGHIGVIDPDRVELSNLQRQITHATPDVDRPKVDSFRETLERLNPDVTVDAREGTLDPDNAEEIVGAHDVVLDCTDNFPTRYLVNDTCRLVGRPLVSGAILGYLGQLTVFRPQAGKPCYRCLYPEVPGLEMGRELSFAGLLGVVPGVIGTLMATQALELILGIGEPLVGKLVTYDARTTGFRTIRYAADPACVLCGEAPTVKRPAWDTDGPFDS